MYFPVNMTFFQIYHTIFWPYWKDLKGLMKDTRADHPPDIDEKLAAVNLAPTGPLTRAEVELPLRAG